MGTQLEIMPLTVVEYMPFPGKVGRGRAVAENGVRYVVKADNGDRRVCATEWICTAIAESLGIPVPQSKVLRMRDGRLVFGSELMSNKMTDLEVSALLLAGQRGNGTIIPNLRELLSQIFALDLLIGNHDRHSENYMVSLEVSEDRTTRLGNLRAFDFESANLLNAKRLPPPMTPLSNTMRNSRLIRAQHGFSAGHAQDVLTRFEKGRDFIMDKATAGLPSAWLPDTERASLFKLVQSAGFEREIAMLHQGLGDGSSL